MARFVQCSAHSCPGLERATWFLVATGFLEAVTQQHQQPRILLTQGLRRLPKFSSLRFQTDTLYWSERWRGWRLGREWFSHSGHWLTPVCLPFLQYWWSIWTGLLHEGHINWQDWQDIELAQLLIFFQHGNNCSMLCSFLLGTGTGNVICDKYRIRDKYAIPGSRQTAESATKQSSQNKMWGCLPSSSFLGFQHCKGDTIHWSDLWRGWKLGREWFSHSGHWLTPACACLQYWWSIWTGLLHEGHINWQDWQDIELAQLLIFFQHGKSCSMLCSFLPGTGTGNVIPGSNRFPGSLSHSSISN